MKTNLRIYDKNNYSSPLVARIKAQMIRKGLNPKTLSEKANVGRSFIYDILSGKSVNPTTSKLAAVAEQLGVSVQYLLSGIHPIMEAKQRDCCELVDISGLDVENTTSGSVVVSKELVDKPYYFNGKWVKDKLVSKPEDLRMVTINTDSMSPTLMQGDVAVIDITQRIPAPPAIFLIFDGFGMVAKRLELISEIRVRVLSDNSKYSNYEIDLGELNILGKLVWFSREV